jgi:hypothetical protein
MDDNQTVTQTPEQTAPNLSLQDLLLVAQTIQTVAQRGAFRAEEMTNIGGLYERIVAFLQASGALKTADEAPAEEPTAEEVPTAGEENA